MFLLSSLFSDIVFIFLAPPPGDRQVSHHVDDVQRGPVPDQDTNGNKSCKIHTNNTTTHNTYYNIYKYSNEDAANDSNYSNTKGGGDETTPAAEIRIRSIAPENILYFVYYHLCYIIHIYDLLFIDFYISVHARGQTPKFARSSTTRNAG